MSPGLVDWPKSPLNFFTNLGRAVFCPSCLPTFLFDFKKKVSTYHKTGHDSKYSLNLSKPTTIRLLSTSPRALLRHADRHCCAETNTMKADQLFHLCPQAIADRISSPQHSPPRTHVRLIRESYAGLTIQRHKSQSDLAPTCFELTARRCRNATHWQVDKWFLLSCAQAKSTDPVPNATTLLHHVQTQ